MTSMDSRDILRITKKWAAEVKGWKGAKGGWIYDSAERSICQGWDSVWRSNRTPIMDWLTAKHTAFTSFREMTEETGETYQPTLLARGRDKADIRALADAFDEAMERRRSFRRAYRGIGYERFVAMRAERWYGGWTVRDTSTGQNVRDGNGTVLEYHASTEEMATKAAAGMNWRREHGYPIGHGVTA